MKDDGSWRGWKDCRDDVAFLWDSGEVLWTAMGRSWFRLMICRASWVFPKNTQAWGLRKSRLNIRMTRHRTDSINVF